MNKKQQIYYQVFFKPFLKPFYRNKANGKAFPLVSQRGGYNNLIATPRKFQPHFFFLSISELEMFPLVLQLNCFRLSFSVKASDFLQKKKEKINHESHCSKANIETLCSFYIINCTTHFFQYHIYFRHKYIPLSYIDTADKELWHNRSHDKGNQSLKLHNN